MTRPCWLRRALRNRHRRAIEQASHRWRGDRDDRRAVKSISTQVQTEGGFQNAFIFAEHDVPTAPLWDGLARRGRMPA